MTTDPRALLDAYAASPLYSAPDFEAPAYDTTLADVAPAAFAALRAILDLHTPGKTYCWCSQRLPCSTVQAITAALEADR